MPSPRKKTSKQPAMGDEPREHSGRKAAATAPPSERKRGSTRASEVKHSELYPRAPMPKRHQDKPGIEAEGHRALFYASRRCAAPWPSWAGWTYW